MRLVLSLLTIIGIGVFSAGPVQAVLVSGGSSPASGIVSAHDEPAEKKPSKAAGRGTMRITVQSKSRAAQSQAQEEAPAEEPQDTYRMGQIRNEHPLAAEVENTSPVVKTVKSKRAPNAYLRGTLRGGTGTASVRTTGGSGTISGTASVNRRLGIGGGGGGNGDTTPVTGGGQF